MGAAATAMTTHRCPQAIKTKAFRPRAAGMSRIMVLDLFVFLAEVFQVQDQLLQRLAPHIAEKSSAIHNREALKSEGSQHNT
eukprot:1116071-Amphidinium_carterae.3